jgi:hypothetical protein
MIVKNNPAQTCPLWPVIQSAVVVTLYRINIPFVGQLPSRPIERATTFDTWLLKRFAFSFFGFRRFSFGVLLDELS